ncbi:hypothetical protein PR048_032191 [Dryococelus australis]|uniref:Uncharacterized protein n=1 Tax=Dryococelus australis TaxID=614101 RepID=A0ABQ9G1H8_9NEOP|nr:hypothetical protein PR048_032191 [Dryococelus australis]
MCLTVVAKRELQLLVQIILLALQILRHRPIYDGPQQNYHEIQNRSPVFSLCHLRECSGDPVITDEMSDESSNRKSHEYVYGGRFAKCQSLTNGQAGSLRIFECGNRAGRCRWSASFLGDLRFPPPFHSGAAPYSPRFTPIGSQGLDANASPLILQCTVDAGWPRFVIGTLRFVIPGKTYPFPPPLFPETGVYRTEAEACLSCREDATPWGKAAVPSAACLGCPSCFLSGRSSLTCDFASRLKIPTGGEIVYSRYTAKEMGGGGNTFVKFRSFDTRLESCRPTLNNSRYLDIQYVIAMASTIMCQGPRGQQYTESRLRVRRFDMYRKEGGRGEEEFLRRLASIL